VASAPNYYDIWCR